MTFNVEMSYYVSSSGESQIRVRLYYFYRTVYLPTPYSVEPHFFDRKKQEVKTTHPKANEINQKIKQLTADYMKAAEVLRDYVQVAPADDVRKAIVSFVEEGRVMQASNGYDFFSVAERVLFDYRQNNQSGSASNLQSAITRLREFRKGKELPFQLMNVPFLDDYRRWYIPERGGEVSFNRHLRYIKIVFREAHKLRILDRDVYPFEYYQIKNDYNVPIKCLSVQELKILEGQEGFGRDMFLISLFLCGMNIIDILKLRPPVGGFFEAERSKTGVYLRLEEQPELKAIADKYRDETGKYYFNLAKNKKRQFDRNVIGRRANNQLKEIAEEHRMKSFTLMWSRHTWATIANSCGVSDDIIDKALMHKGTGIIERYRQFDFSLVDEANRKVIERVLSEY